MCSQKGVLMDIYSLSKMNLKLLKYFVLCYFFEIFGDAKLYSVRVYNTMTLALTIVSLLVLVLSNDL